MVMSCPKEKKPSHPPLITRPIDNKKSHILKTGLRKTNQEVSGTAFQNLILWHCLASPIYQYPICTMEDSLKIDQNLLQQFIVHQMACALNPQ